MGTPTYLKPEFSDFESCIGYAKQFYQHTGGSGTEDEMGTIFGNRPTSSWFTLKLNAMRAYELVVVDAGKVGITELSEGIIRPKDEREERASTIAALRAFPLFFSLVERYLGKAEPGLQFVKNVLEAEGRAKPNKSGEWATCFLKAARYAHLFETSKAFLVGNGDRRDPPPPLPKPPEVSDPLTQDEISKGWLVYPVPVGDGVAKIIVPRELPRYAWEKMKKLLDAIEPEKKDGPGGPS